MPCWDKKPCHGFSLRIPSFFAFEEYYAVLSFQKKNTFGFESLASAFQFFSICHLDLKNF